MVKGVIFDVDGTLLNTVPTIAFHVNRALKECGYRTLEVQDYNHILGYGARYLIDHALQLSSGEKKSAEEVKRVMDIYNGYYISDPLYLTKPYDGIVDVIKELKDRGVKIACFSNKTHSILLEVIGQMFGEGEFDEVLGQVDGVKEKPDPTGMYNIMDKLGLDKSEVIFVGDTEVDIKTGTNAGTFTLAVTWGFRDREEIEGLGEDAIIDDAREIPNFLV